MSEEWKELGKDSVGEGGRGQQRENEVVEYIRTRQRRVKEKGERKEEGRERWRHGGMEGQRPLLLTVIVNNHNCQLINEDLSAAIRLKTRFWIQSQTESLQTLHG